MVWNTVSYKLVLNFHYTKSLKLLGFLPSLYKLTPLPYSFLPVRTYACGMVSINSVSSKYSRSIFRT